MAEARTVLVTGGAGYIGSHVALLLAEAGYRVVVYDNLSSGHAWAVLDAELVVGDLGDRDRLAALMAGRQFDAVLHFAAHIWVAESVRAPAKYYRNNVANALALFELAAAHGIRHVVFSSTAAVYGEPGRELLDEDLPLAPINPYGASKMMAERVLADVAGAAAQRFAILRYFNVAGADPQARIGEATPDNVHLVKLACETALGLRPAMRINGTDYPTPDGTCVRDYIHVADLARAHLAALEHLERGGASTVLNCGYGHGASVRAVLETARRVTGIDFPIEEGPRRPGDPSVLVAGNAKIRRVLDWQPQHDDLEFIIRTAWVWEQALQERIGGAPPAPDG
ncbi:MAG TPA: UDP-glucose 4-epimerase GalE [Geminicoccaceae bacterium]|nr:UDP-glucose 4-epimerase GalE [Geminicoccaceae bacterium]